MDIIDGDCILRILYYKKRKNTATTKKNKYMIDTAVHKEHKKNKTKPNEDTLFVS